MERVRDFFVLLFCVLLFIYEFLALNIRIMFRSIKKKRSRETTPGFKFPVL
ncbi:hypothetical protein T2812B_07135 [Thermotoga sp. 2812B]|nr:hypothetical protein T2812B_07135 [Thermotoga sp. 2812B]EJX25678.1 hypothetical protein EMP_07782 [Thermotoga sp. EMP]